MIDNYTQFKKFIASFDNKPKLLLHACCAPCSSHCLMLLRDYFDLAIYFSNDNIYPESEYNTRLAEIKKFVKDIGLNCEIITDPYNDKDYYDAVKGLEHLGEKSIRCYECYKFRMIKTAKKADELGFDYFTTTLSISPYKVESWINEIGYSLEGSYNVKWLYSNFKKENGYLHSVELSDEYGLYRQDYCGCKFSIEERNKLDETVTKKD